MHPSSERSRTLGWLRVVSGVSLLAVGAAVAVVTFRQSPPDPQGQLQLAAFLRRAYQNGLPRWVTLDAIQFGANVVMFTPIGFFGAVLLPGRRWLVVPAAAGASSVIEIVQALRLPERVGSVGDVVANTLGALIGYLLAWLLIRTLTRRSMRAAGSADTAPIPIVRVLPTPDGRGQY
jgi:uncharacterized membrane protein HdeD (DUF308 family)